MDIKRNWYFFSQILTLPIGGASNLYPIIPSGNYTSGATFAAVLQTALNAVSSNYTVTFSDVTSKLTFATTKVGVTAFSFTFGASTNSGNFNPRLYLGFPGGVTSSSGLSLTAPNVLLLSGPNYLYMNSVKLGQTIDVSLPQGAFNLGGGNGGPQLCKIPVTCNTGGVIYWQDPDPQKWFTTENLPSLDSIDFYMTLGNTTTQLPLRLNGLSFSIKFGILTVNMSDTKISQSTRENERVVKRIRPN